MLRPAINRLGTFNKCLAFAWPAIFAARSQVRESSKLLQTRFEVFVWDEPFLYRPSVLLWISVLGR